MQLKYFLNCIQLCQRILNLKCHQTLKLLDIRSGVAGGATSGATWGTTSGATSGHFAGRANINVTVFNSKRLRHNGTSVNKTMIVITKPER